MSQEPTNGSEIIKPTRLFGLRIDRQQVIKAFFSANAAVTIAVLLLIIWSLLSEGAGFLPTYRHELAVYRQAGLEYVDYIQKPLSGHEAMLSKLNRAYNAELNTLSMTSRDRRNAALLAKTHVETKVILQREALTAALADPASDPDKVTALREAVSTATAAAVAEEPLPAELFSADEQKQLRSALASLQHDQSEMPAIFTTLISEAQEKDKAAKEKYAAFSEVIEQFEEAAEPINELLSGMRETVVATKDAAVQQHMAEDARTKLFEAAAKAKTAEQREDFEKDAAATETAPINYAERIQPLLAKLPEYEQLVPTYLSAVRQSLSALPKETATAEAKSLLKEVRHDGPELIKAIEKSVNHLKAWKWDKPIPVIQALTAFLFGGDWITNSSWQDFYGVVPLLTGSLLISITALTISLPISVAAAIYVNQFASQREQELIKPVIEFIQAIPSVVLGFIGISVVGDLIKDSSNIAWLQWLPGFPIQERLNMFNAGCLLALMAIPTMFSLAEDAINNVPRAFSEASEALGSTKLQTVFRVIVPASISGIFAATLLGLGRIIGETMVVLLVAGNRIAIPNFSDGIGAVFQPAHTLTGIIAQELGEVSRGSSHWQALFMVGILLFFISLAINWGARIVVRKFQLPKI